jgi:peptidoglycan/xylan/chitin deacetylase (PgdA/CDA1 family)
MVMGAHGLMFHHFHDGDEKSAAVRHPRAQGTIGGDDLRRVLDRIGRGRILPAMEFLDRAQTGRLEPHHLCVTFDDNLRCQYDVAGPVLDEMKITAFWFVYTSVMQGNIERLEVYRRFRTTQFHNVDDFYAAFFVGAHESPWGRRIDGALKTFQPSEYLREYPFYTDSDKRFRFVRDEVLGPTAYSAVMDAMMADARYDVRGVARTLWMRDEHVKSLHASGHVIGLHSHTHPTRLERLGEDEQRYEYRANHAHLTAVLGEPPACVSHPCNSYSAMTLEILRELGVTVGFRANMQASASFGPLELPREDHANLIRRIAA